jgi:hypothetical protein
MVTGNRSGLPRRNAVNIRSLEVMSADGLARIFPNAAAATKGQAVALGSAELQPALGESWVVPARAEAPRYGEIVANMYKVDRY